MKFIYLSPFKRLKNLSSAAIILLTMMTAQPANAQSVFSQDFNSSNVVSSYVGAPPNNTQFDNISTSGAGTTVNITGGALTYVRAGANAGAFTRTTDFSPVPTAIIYRYSLTVGYSGFSDVSTAAVFQVGSGFTSNQTAEANANVYARWAIDLRGTGNWRVNDLTNFTTGSTLNSGTYQVMWVMNNSGATLSYTDPNGTVRTIANDRMDLWIGNTRYISGANVQTATQTITDLKFVFTSGSATIAIDNINISQFIPVVTTQPTASLSGCLGSPVTMTAAASGAPAPAVKWQMLISGTWTDIPGATSNSYVIPSASAGDAGSYQAIYTNSEGAVTTNTVVLTLNSASVGGTASPNATVCSGTNGGTINLSGNTGSILRWESSTNGTTWTTISSTGGLTSYSFSNLNTTTYYRAVIQNGSCASASSSNDTVFVNAQPTQFTVTGGGTFCSNSVSGVTVGLNGSQSGVSYQLLNGGINFGGPVTGTGSAISFGNVLVGGTYTVIATNANNCTRSMSGSATVTVKPNPAVTVTASPSPACDSSRLTALNTGGTLLSSTVTNSSHATIDDEDPNTVTRTVTMPAGVLNSLSDITLTININHTQVGDLRITLMGPCGSAIIINRPGGSNNSNDLTSSGNYVFSNSFPTVFTGSGNPVPTGNYNATFSGITVPCNIAGTWTLKVEDLAGNHGGDLNSWTLTIGNSSVYTTVFGGPPVIGTTTYLTSNHSTATAGIRPPGGINTYTATTTDGAGCTATSTVNVAVDPTPLATAIPATQSICSGGTFTDIVLGTSNSVAGTTFNWTRNRTDSVTGIGAGGSGNITAASLVNLSNAPITVTFTIVPSSSVNTTCAGAPVTATITVKPTPVLTATPPSKTICNNTSPGIGLTGNVTGTTFNWTVSTDPDISGSSSGSGNSITQTLTNSGAAAEIATYTVTPTANGCPGSPVTVPVTVDPALVVSSSSGAIDCYGNTASITIIASGGTSPYSGTGVFAVVSGTHVYTVTDDLGCSSTTSVTIANGPSQFLLNAVVTQPHCDGDLGSVTLQPNGGTSGYTFDATPTSGLAAGTYTYTVTDANNCSTTASITINSAPPALTLSGTPSQPLCFGDLGSVALVTQGGTSGYTYNSTPTIGLAAGLYDYTITDANGCQATTSVTINPAPVKLFLSVKPTDPNCFGEAGYVQLSVFGGTPVYTFGITPTTGLPAGSYVYTVTDANGCTATASTVIHPPPTQVILTATPTQPMCFGDFGTVALSTTGGVTTYTYDNSPTTGLAPGVYQFTVTDSHSCAAVASVTINPVPDQLIITATATQPPCFGDLGNVSLNTTGGTGSYTFSNTGVSNLSPGTYDYTVTDANGCISSTSIDIQNAPPLLTLSADAVQPACFGDLGYVLLNGIDGTPGYSFTGDATNNLQPGNYLYTVTDAHGCSSTSSATVNPSPSLLTLTATATPLLCFGDLSTVTLVASGGTGQYFFDGTPTSGLPAGIYDYGINDANGCIAYAEAIVDPAPPLLTLSATPSQPLCSGQLGLVSLNANGGFGTYAFNNTPVSNLAAGNYDYTVTDANGCTATASASVSPAPPRLTLTATAAQPRCSGETGSVVLLAGGGTGAYSFNATPVGNLGAGTYNYTVTDANGCTATATANISPAPALLTLSANPAQPLCFGDLGQVTLNANGGTGSYAFNSTPVLNLGPGNYLYAVTDDNGCNATASATVNAAPSLLTLSATTTQPLCFGETGQVNLHANGGTGIYGFGATPVTNLGAGNYLYTVTDDNGCTATASAGIQPAPSLLILSATPTDPGCSGQSGSVLLNANGGTGSYTYDGTPTTNLTAGTYHYTVSDANGCTATVSVSIQAAPSLLTLNAIPTQPLCFGEPGSISLIAQGGTGSYAFNATPTTNLGPGNYLYAVTDDNGCTTTTSATINAAPSLLTLSAVPTQPVCFGELGNVNLNANGGTGSYTYNATPVANLIAGNYLYSVTDDNECSATASATVQPAPAQLTLAATPVNPGCAGQLGQVVLDAHGGTGSYSFDATPTANLDAGIYEYTVHDANGCTATASATIDAAPAQLTLTATPTQPLCFGETGSVTLATNGGTGSFVYNSTPVANLVPGNYLYAVTDDNGCSATASASINPAPGLLTISAHPIQPSCSGGSGSVILITGGGTGIYTFNNTPTNNLAAGIYTYSVTDENGCMASASATINLVPDQLVLTVTPTQPRCNGDLGNVSLNATGGTGNYSFSPVPVSGLSAGDYTYTVTDDNGCTGTASANILAAPALVTLAATPEQPACFGNPGSVTLEANGGTGNYTFDGTPTTGLSPGVYEYGVHDENGCTATTQVTIEPAPSLLTLTATPTQPGCSGNLGSVLLSANGGSGSYIFNSTPTANLPAGSYDYTVTDSRGCTANASATILSDPSLLSLSATPIQPACSGDFGSVSLAANGGTGNYEFSVTPTSTLAAGTYVYSVTDDNGCLATASAVINNPPDPLVLSAIPSQPGCSGGRGSVFVQADGGTPVYAFNNTSTSNLTPGTYFYTVTDANGCTATASASVSSSPSPMVVTATVTQIRCFGETGSVLLNISGGNGNYTFNSTPTTNLAAGTYDYTVTDANGCSGNVSATIDPAPPRLVMSAKATHPLCFGGTGHVDLSSIGGASGYVYSGDPTTNLQPGTYSYTVTDANGCFVTASATINPPPPAIVGVATGTASGCGSGGASGTCTVTASGGSGTYNAYAWNTSPVQNSQTATGLAPGTYVVTITDNYGCTATASATVNTSGSPVCNIGGTASLCNSGTTSLCAASGMSSWQWSNGATTQCITVSRTGNFTVTIVGQNGCTSSCSKTISPGVSVVLNRTNASCANGYQGYITLNVSRGTRPYAYLWSNGATTSSLTGITTPGTYSVRVTDANGCQASASTTVSVNASPGDYTTGISTFNNTSIATGRRIWFSSVVTVHATQFPLTIRFFNQRITSSRFNLTVPNATLVITTAVTQATTVFNGTEWVTTSPPIPNGEYFISGVVYAVPSQIPGNLHPVSWTGVFASSRPCVSIEWEWAAAVYSNILPTNLSQLAVKPVDGSVYSRYHNNDRAGTPENYKAYVVAGGRGTGGSDYIGSHTKDVNVTPCAPTRCHQNNRTEDPGQTIEQSLTNEDIGIGIHAYPNPFSNSTTLEFQGVDQAGHALLEVYNLAGEKISTLFDGEIESGVIYKAEFRAEELAAGLYMYKLQVGDQVVNGKLMLMK